MQRDIWGSWTHCSGRVETSIRGSVDLISAIISGMKYSRHQLHVAKGLGVIRKWHQFSSICDMPSSSNFRILSKRLRLLKYDVVWGVNFQSQSLTLLFCARKESCKTGWVFLCGSLASEDQYTYSPISSLRREEEVWYSPGIRGRGNCFSWTRRFMISAESIFKYFGKVF